MTRRDTTSDGHTVPFELGYTRTDLRRRLTGAVLRGEKTATSSLREDYEPHTADPLPRPGQRGTLLGYDDEPVGLVEVTEVSIVPAGQVDLQFARDEGEGFNSVEEWREAHNQFWAPRIVTDSTLVVCERFRLL